MKSILKKILNIFRIEPYEGDLTGTTIIIPYIDEQMLLENNQIEYKDSEDNRIRPFGDAVLKIIFESLYKDGMLRD